MNGWCAGRNSIEIDLQYGSFEEPKTISRFLGCLVVVSVFVIASETESALGSLQQNVSRL